MVVSALVFGKGMAWLRGGWASRVVSLLLCRETVSELLKVLNYPKFKLTAERCDDLLEDYLPFGEVVTRPKPVPALPVKCRDKTHDIFLHLAIFAQADFLVTGDADLLDLAALSPVPIIGVRHSKS